MKKKVELVQHAPAKWTKKKRVAAYTRVSVSKDTMHQSLSAQISYYIKLIQNDPGWEYCGVYADEGLTGTNEDRAGFQRMLSDCRDGKLDIVITKSISRFARNTVTLLNTIRELRSLGISVIFEEQGIDTMTAEGELLLTLLASFAQAESLSASENKKWQIRKGFREGSTKGIYFPLGYDFKGGIRVNRKQAEIVKEIYARFLDGDSLSAIERYLKENRIKGARGGDITTGALRLILSNEKYTGNMMLQKTYVKDHLEKKKMANRGELPMYYVENSHEAIIDADTFERAQARLRKIEVSAEGRTPQMHSAFTSRIRCAKCGLNYIRAYNSRPVWLCRKYKKLGRKECDAKQIPEEILKSVCCEVLCIDTFDDEQFQRKVDHIISDNDKDSNILRFVLRDGEIIVKRWKYPSRSKSWTPEMKERARQAAKKKGAGDGKER